ncbi:MAG: prolyl-tRNA synthetase associated domain-containing protein [bacterium]|nr:prolyl-tRNA synthetase associated domain-containing protein [bacterium]
MNMTIEIYNILKKLDIPFSKYVHPAVFTCQEAALLLTDIPGFCIKNLFLKDDKGRQYFLVVAPENKKIELKQLALKLNVRRLGFASPRRLKIYLGIEPGSVSPLALINDKENNVTVYFDNALKNQKEIQFHPLINTETVILSIFNLEKLLLTTGHKINFIEC